MKQLLWIIPLVMLAGCSVRPPIVGRDDPYDSAQIHFDSDKLRRDTAIQRPILTRDQFGLLHVTVPIRSAIDKQLYVDYRVRFFDRNHAVLDQLGWASKTLAANTPDQIDVVSTDKRTEDFQMDFRYPPGYLGAME